MKITIGAIVLAACAREAPLKQDLFLGPQLGESRKSPGADPTKPAPLTADDPQVMNMSASINPAQLGRATAAPPRPVPPQAPTTVTPVQPLPDIAPPTMTPTPVQPPANTAAPPPAQAPTPAPTEAPAQAPAAPAPTQQYQR